MTDAMASWGCQAGYLVLRPVGALSRLKTRKKNWYVLDESSGLLAYYRNESEARNQSPIGTINVQDAAISLVLDQSNQFVIHSGGKEYLLTAENHEAMMIWVLALQAKRDLWNDKHEVLSDSDITSDRSHNLTSFSSEQDVTSKVLRARNAGRKPQVVRTHSLQSDLPAKVISQGHPTLSRVRSMWTNKTNQQCSNGENCCRNSEAKSRISRKVQLSRNSDTDDRSKTSTTDDNNNQGKKKDSNSETSTDSEGSSNNGCTQRITDVPKDRIHMLRRLNSDIGRNEEIGKDRTSSLSGTSVSSDSAVGHSDSNQSCRLQDLESQLISTKCELAKALNRESTYKNTIEERDIFVTELEQRLKAIEDQAEDECWKNSPERGCQKLQEKCRILQNHNRFLNEEVLKLSRMHHQEQRKNQAHQLRLQDLEETIDKFKRDYVFLLQSSLRITCNDGPEIMEVYLYGGSRHKDRVLQLVDEARRVNPSLPTYESLLKPQCHVDSLGFRHSYQDNGYILHYICRQLHLHYCTQLPSYCQHLAAWKRYLRQHGTDLSRTKELKQLVRSGIPNHLRRRVWCSLYKTRVKDIMEEKGQHYYSNLCSLAPESELVAQHRRQIALDLLRTMPDNVRFCDQNADGVRKMQEVLQAFCLHNPNLGYCQGMNFLVGMCLLFLEPEDAFWCLVAITEKYFTSNYFDQNLIGAQADQEVLKDLLQDKLPTLHRHLCSLDIELCTVTLNWFLAIFFDCVPIETLLRIWDCFLLEGPKVLFRFALAILKLQEEALLSKPDTVSVMRQLKASAKLLFDIDSFVKTAFEELKPFPRRQDIAIKQACYYKTLREQSKRKALEKETLKERENLFNDVDTSGASHQLVIECAAVYDKDKLWICHGHHTGAQLSKVNTDESIMYRLNIELESRVMCMHALGDEVMLLGTLSHFVYAYSTRSRKLLWEIRLNDSVLSLTSHQEDGVQQVYAGLADGTLSIIENIQGIQPKPDTFYIMIGSSPITCLQLVDRRLWCACGNRVVILSARTLDTADQFQTSTSGLDYVSMLVPGEQGIWIALRGSSVLQLWDFQTLTCRLLFDIRDNHYPRSPKEEESLVNQSRVTALLPFDGSVLVGTGEGSLIIYNVLSRLSSCPSMNTSPCPLSNSSASIDKIQEKIQELLLERHRQETDTRHRNDSGCYTTPTPTPFCIRSRRESSLVTTEFLPVTTENDQEGESPSPETEDRSETTSCSTIRRRDPESLLSPETRMSPILDEKSVTMLPPQIDSTYNLVDTSTLPAGNCNQTSKLKRFVNTRKYASLLELDKNSPSRLRRMVHTRSADDVRQWTSGDNLSSSLTSDSYEFDDLFIAYTEDEMSRYSRKSSKVPSMSDTEVFLQSLRDKNWCGNTQNAKNTYPFSDRIIQLPSWYKDGLITQSSDNESAVGVEIIKENTESKTDSAPSTANDSSSHWISGEDASTIDGVCTTKSTRRHDLLQLGEWSSRNQRCSDSASNVSFSSTEVPYVLELCVQEKIKISDKPIRCLLETRVNNEPVIISGAGCYGDDEAVLKWTKESDGLWTNDPIIEVCPYTNAIKPSPFTRSRMPRRTSVMTSASSTTDSDATITGKVSRCSISSASSANSVFGTGLAKVQNILARVHEKS